MRILHPTRTPYTTRAGFRGLFHRTLWLASLLAVASCGALYGFVRTLLHRNAANFIAVPLALVLAALSTDIVEQEFSIAPYIARLLSPHLLLVALPIASQALVMHCNGFALPLSAAVVAGRVLVGTALGLFLKRVYHVPVPGTAMLCACLGVFDYVAPLLVAEFVYRLDVVADPRRFSLALLNYAK